MRNVPIFLFLPSIIKSAISSISYGEGHSNGQIPNNKIVSNSKIFRRVSLEYLKKCQEFVIPFKSSRSVCLEVY